MTRKKLAAVALSVVLTVLVLVVCAVVMSPTDGFVDECHALGGRVLTRNVYDRTCLGAGGTLPLVDGYR